MKYGRRAFLQAIATLPLAGCASLATSLNDNPGFHRFLRLPETLDLAILGAGQPLARQYTARDVSPDFRANGFDPPADAEYRRWIHNGWRGYRLVVDGLVRIPRAYDLATLRRGFLRRTQITRHDCVEGWSVIGEWSGVRLADILTDCGPTRDARYVVFHCMDADEGGTHYYESLSLFQAAHPQTLLAYDLNGKPVPIKNGAPLRLTVPTQLGYKSAKYVKRIEVVAALGGRLGRGGYWEDQGYEWFAGV